MTSTNCAGDFVDRLHKGRDEALHGITFFLSFRWSPSEQKFALPVVSSAIAFVNHIEFDIDMGVEQNTDKTAVVIYMMGTCTET